MGNRKMMNRTSPLTGLTILLSACAALAGCKTAYVFEFKDSKSGNPIAGAHVVAESFPRMYSYVDIRHYLPGSHEPDIAKGTTDSQGKAKLSLDSELGIRHVTLNDKWFIRQSLPEWRPMWTELEFQGNATHADLQALPDRPLIKIEKK
jgi:hypothetical protein